MAKKVSSKATGAARKPAKPKAAKNSGSKSKAKAGAKRPRAKSQGTSDAVRKLLESPLVADLLAVGATAALAAIAQHGFGGKGAGKGTGKAVKEAGKAAATAMGRRLGNEFDEIRKGAKAKAGAATSGGPGRRPA